MVALDPSHVTYALLDTMLATPFSERPADFANLSVVLGTDPYVYVNETTPNDLSDQRRDVELLSEGLAGLGGAAAGLPVSQMAMYERPGRTSKRAAAPPRAADVDIPWRRVGATPRPRRGRSAETSRGDAAAATRIVRGDASRRRRDCDVDSPWRRASRPRYPCWDCPPAHCVCEYNGETYVSEFPAAGPLEAMAFVAATRSQGSGLLFYSYYRLLGYPSSTPLPADALEDRLSSMRRVGSKLRDAAPTLLTTRRDDLLNVTSASPDVALSYYETGPDTFVLFAVNGRNALGAFDVVASNLSVALSDVEPWAVVRVDVDAGGARVRRVALDSESRRVVH